MRRLASAAMLAAVLLVGTAAAGTYRPKPGSLDRTFGKTGRVTTKLTRWTEVCEGCGMLIQPDGKVVVVGYTGDGADADVALARYNPDGSLDKTFGTRGIARPSMGEGFEVGLQVARQSDGKLVVAGDAFEDGRDDFLVARYNANGTLDDTFGTSGVVTTPIGSFGSIAFALAIQPSDQKIVVGGTAYGGTSYEFALARYDSDGALDSGFGSGGIVTDDVSGGPSGIDGLAIQADGMIVAVGTSYWQESQGNRITLARFHTNGALDTSFGTGGIASAAVGNESWANAVTLQGDGKILVGGGAWLTGETGMVAVRFDGDGALDPAFGSGGLVAMPVGEGNSDADGVVVQRDDKIVLSGFAVVRHKAAFAVARYTPAGALDATFGRGGLALTPFQRGSAFGVQAAIQNDGKIVVAGDFMHPSEAEARTGGFALARYNG